MLVLVPLSSTLVLVVVSMVVLVDDVSTKLTLVVELSSTLVLVGSSRLVGVDPFVEDDTFELGVVPIEPELESSLEWSLDANDDPHQEGRRGHRRDHTDHFSEHLGPPCRLPGPSVRDVGSSPHQRSIKKTSRQPTRRGGSRRRVRRPIRHA